MELNQSPQGKNMRDVPAASWLAVGLLDGVWAGGKVTTAVNIKMRLNKVHLVHVLAEEISKKNSYKFIDTCFAYCPELDMFLPFATSVAAASAVTEQYTANRALVIEVAVQLIKNLNDINNC